jgi:hypothetical protein
MAYMNQERKQELGAEVKKVLKAHSLKGSLSVRNHSTIVLKITSGPVDFITNYNEMMKERGNDPHATPAKDHLSPNPYWYQEHFSGASKRVLGELFNALNKGNHDRSDIQTDYFDVGWYVDVNIGSWNDPYVVVK